MTTVDGKTSWKFAPRTTVIPTWEFVTKFGAEVPEPYVTDRKTMALYDEDHEDDNCELNTSHEHRELVRDLPGPIKCFAMREKMVKNFRQRQRKFHESVLDFEELISSGQMFPEGCSGNGDSEVLSQEGTEYDSKNLGVPLAVTIPNWVTFGEVAPRRIDQDHSSQNTDIFKFEDFMTLARALYNNGMLCDQCFIEPIFAEDSDQVIARRYIVVIMAPSAALLSMYDRDEDEDDSEEEGEDVNEDEQPPERANNEENNQGNPAAPLDMRVERLRRIKWSINYLWSRYLETGETDAVYPGKKKETKKFFTRKGDKEKHSKRMALKKWAIIAESFGLCVQGAVVDPIMSSDTLNMSQIIHERGASPPMYAASEVFAMLSCVLFDNLRQEGSQVPELEEHEPGDEETIQPPGPNDYEPMQTNPLHYIQEAVDIHRLLRTSNFPDICKGIAFPPIRRKHATRYLEAGVSTAVMCISPEHFLSKSWESMANPEEAYIEHLHGLRTKAGGKKRKLDSIMAMMAGGDTENMGTIAQANRGMWARVAAGDETMTAVPVPEARRSANNIRQLMQPDSGDEELRAMRDKYENPQSLVDKVKNAADVKHFHRCKAELDEHMSIAYAKGIENLSTEELGSLLTRVDSDERAAQYLSESLVKQARTAARNKQYDLLSTAQVVVLQDKLEMTPEDYCIGEKGIDRDLSPLANKWNNDILFYEEFEGIWTAHAALLVLDASKKSAWIPHPVMRINVLNEGSAEAGKDFMKSVIVKYTKEGVFQTCAKSTEASQNDPDRPHARGCVKKHSETPVYLNEKHPRFYQEVQDKKEQFTECRYQYEKQHRYTLSDGTERFVSTNFKKYTDSANWVNTNDDMSITDGAGGINKSKEAMLSRFMHFKQPKSNRTFGPMGDNRMYMSKKKGLNNSVTMAESRFHRNSLQNDLFHAIYSLLVELGTVPTVDLTVFDSVSAEILRLYDKKGMRMGPRMKQQVWDIAYVFAIDDWWAKNFMLKSGTFVCSHSCPTKDVPIGLLVKHLRADPVICSEECALFAWQIMQNSGSASQGVMNHVATLLKHMVDNSLSPDGTGDKKVDAQTPCQRVMRFFEAPSDSDKGGAPDDDSGLERYEYLYVHLPEDVDGGGSLPGATHLDRVCEMLVRYNKQFNVMDKDHNAASMHTTIMHYSRRNETFRATEYEFRLNNVHTGQAEHVFSHDDLLWNCFLRHMDTMEQVMDCLGMAFVSRDEDNYLETRRRQILHTFTEYCIFNKLAQALNAYRAKDDTTSSMFYNFYTKVRRLVEAMWTEDEKYVIKSSMDASSREAVFTDAMYDTGRFKRLLPMPTPIIFDWSKVNDEMVRTAEFIGKDSIYSDNNKLKPVALNYIKALEANLGNRLRHGLGIGEKEDDSEDRLGDDVEESSTPSAKRHKGDKDGPNRMKVMGGGFKRTRPRVEVVQCKTNAHDAPGGGQRFRGGFGGGQPDAPVMLNYVKFDVQAILAWASAARSNANRADIVEEYAHNNIVSRKVVLHQMARDYKKLGCMELKRNAGKRILIRNPHFCSESVSNVLVTTACNTIRKEWAKQRKYIVLGCDIDDTSFIRILNLSLARRAYSIAKEIKSRNDVDISVSESSLGQRYKTACITNFGNPYRYLYQPNLVYGGRHGTDFMPIASTVNGDSSNRVFQSHDSVLSLPEFSIPEKDQEDIKTILCEEVTALNQTSYAAHEDVILEEKENSELELHQDIFRRGNSATTFFMETGVELFSAVSQKVQDTFLEQFVFSEKGFPVVDVYMKDQRRAQLRKPLSEIDFSEEDGTEPLGTPTFAYFDDVVSSARCLSVNCTVAMTCKLCRIAEECDNGKENMSIASVFDGSDVSRGSSKEHDECMEFLSDHDVMLFRVTLSISDPKMDVTKGEFCIDTLKIDYSSTMDNYNEKKSCFGDPLFTMNMRSMGYIIRSMYTHHKLMQWRAENRDNDGEKTDCGLPLLRRPSVPKCHNPNNPKKQRQKKRKRKKKGMTLVEDEDDALENVDNGVVGLIQGFMAKL